MTTKTLENANFEVARRISDKFDFYVIALVFTILGLSIQTSSFAKVYWQYFFEIAGWILLLASGLAGLSRLEWMPTFYLAHGVVQEHKKTLSAFKCGLKDSVLLVKKPNEFWTKKEMEENMPEINDAIIVTNNKIEKISKSAKVKYCIHKWAFVVGIILLIVSRTILGVDALFAGEEQDSKNNVKTK